MNVWFEVGGCLPRCLLSGVMDSVSFLIKDTSPVLSLTCNGLCMNQRLSLQLNLVFLWCASWRFAFSPFKYDVFWILILAQWWSEFSQMILRYPVMRFMGADHNSCVTGFASTIAATELEADVSHQVLVEVYVHCSMTRIIKTCFISFLGGRCFSSGAPPKIASVQCLENKRLFSVSALGINTTVLLTDRWTYNLLMKTVRWSLKV